MVNIDKIFDKWLDIITENKVYHIEKKKIFINDGLSSFYGEAKIMQKENNIYILDNIYSYDDGENRLRYSYAKVVPKKSFEIIEYENGKESPILVIESYYYYSKIKDIGSIGGIEKLNSDKITNVTAKSDQKLIKRLFKKDENITIDDLLAA